MRAGCQAQQIGYVLAIGCDRRVRTPAGPVRAGALVTGLPAMPGNRCRPVRARRARVTTTGRGSPSPPAPAPTREAGLGVRGGQLSKYLETVLVNRRGPPQVDPFDRRSGLGAARLDRRGTRPGGPTLVASPRRVALRATQRGLPRSVADSAYRDSSMANRSASTGWADPPTPTTMPLVRIARRAPSSAPATRQDEHM